MYIVTFIVTLIILIIAAVTFGYGLIQLHNNNGKARTTMGTGFLIALAGIIVAAILSGAFSV
jgi:hypothetical protein